MCACYTKAKYVIQIELKIMYKHINRHFFLHLSYHRSVITTICQRVVDTILLRKRTMPVLLMSSQQSLTSMTLIMKFSRSRYWAGSTRTLSHQVHKKNTKCRRHIHSSVIGSNYSPEYNYNQRYSLYRI